MTGDNSQTALLFAIILGVACVYWIGTRFLARSMSRHPSRGIRFGHSRIWMSQNQLEAVIASSFEKKRIMNGSEYRVFKLIESNVVAARRGYRVFAQTSLGEVLKSPDKNAFFSINSKRVDVLVIDAQGFPVLAVEYQGTGHYQGDVVVRDAIKKEALRKTGVSLLEVSATDNDEQIVYNLRSILGWDSIAPANTLPSGDITPMQSFGRRVG